MSFSGLHFLHKPTVYLHLDVRPMITNLSDTLWFFNIAMENDPFIDEFPIKSTIYRGFSMAMLNNQRVNVLANEGMYLVRINLVHQKFSKTCTLW